MLSNWSSSRNGTEELRECYCGMRTYLRTSCTKKIQEDDFLDALNTAKAHIASILNGLNHTFVNMDHMVASLYKK